VNSRRAGFAGYTCRLTHPNTAQLTARTHHLPAQAAHPDKLEIRKVEELSNTEALAEAFRGVDGVFHMAAVHPKYGFQETTEGRQALVAIAVEGTLSAMRACVAAGVKRVVLTSSLAAVECGNDEGTLTEGTWSKAEVYDSSDKLTNTTWGTHYTYVKSKTEQEKAAVAFASEHGLDLRVVVPGNLCVGPIANKQINGTMTRLCDIMKGTNTLKGAADLGEHALSAAPRSVPSLAALTRCPHSLPLAALTRRPHSPPSVAATHCPHSPDSSRAGVVHVGDVVAAHLECMTKDDATGRYIVTRNMVRIEELFETLKSLYPTAPIAKLDNMDYASGVPGKARSIESRTEKELGLQLTDLRTTLKEAVDSMVNHGYVAASA
jgi:nucleoside-diphosphate-sugar epimerase